VRCFEEEGFLCTFLDEVKKRMVKERGEGTSDEGHETENILT
jgi:hypothetical protein